MPAAPAMLPDDAQLRQKAFDLITEVMQAVGELSAEDRKRLQRVGRLFGLDEPAKALRSLSIVAN